MRAAPAPDVSQDRRGPPEGWLLLRRRGSLWGVSPKTLKELATGFPPRLELKSGKQLVADELLSLAADLEAHPFPRCARRFCSEEVYGLAIWRREPVILVQPDAPPACLSADAPAAADTPNPEMDAHGDNT